MNRKILLYSFSFLIVFAFGLNLVISNDKAPKREKITYNRLIDNINFWNELARKGEIPFNPDVIPKRSKFTGSQIRAFGVTTEDSPDVPVAENNSTQSENSIFINPNNINTVLNSNNSTTNPIVEPGEDTFGADDLYSFNIGESWQGNVEGPGGRNYGDPTTAIGLNGRWFVNYINTNWGQSISFSDNEGGIWKTRTVSSAGPEFQTDKNHMWIDNSKDSPHEGNLYVGWTEFGGVNDRNIVLSRSADSGVNWDPRINISNKTFNIYQGVNIQTGPQGEVYAIWAEYYDISDSDDEDAIGFAKSLDGGITWEASTRIIDDIRGIRETGVRANIRTNSFPVMAVDISNSNNRGNIYVIWPNVGVPGENAGPDIDIYMVRSVDGGENWSEPIRVNQDQQGLGNEHYMSWITCDPTTGALSVIYYDDRNHDEGECEVFCANSTDAGETWEDFKVSDVSFTPSPIPGTAANYFGDYLGISSRDGFVYPIWTDNRTGSAMTYCSPYQYNVLNYPQNLIGDIKFETGETKLNWTYEVAEGFSHFNIYRDGSLTGTATDTTFADFLPGYGNYYYQVTAYYDNESESAASGIKLQWGYPQLSYKPDSIYEKLVVDSMSTKYLFITNKGQLPLFYDITTFKLEQQKARSFCEAKGSGAKEYIKNVRVGNLNKSSGKSAYSDFTAYAANFELSEEYELNVSVGNYFVFDQVGVWIDWDQNDIFDDGMFNMTIVPDTSNPDTTVFSTTFSLPLGVRTGSTRMRVRLTYTGELNPCGTTIWGEVEDYTVNVQNWLDIHPVSDTIQPGEESTIAIDFNAQGIQPGMYKADAIIYSNDPNLEEVVVPLYLEVTETMVSVIAKNAAIACLGETIELFARPHGNYVNPSYRWHSVPEGFDSIIQNPEVTPDTSTWYIVEMLSDSIPFYDSVFIDILPVPEVNLGPDTSFCDLLEWPLDAGDQGVKYFWSTGDTTQTIIVDTNTSFQGYGERTISVRVHGANRCLKTDTIIVGFVDCTGIYEFKNNISFKIFPNPTAGQFTIDLKAVHEDEVNISVVDLSGRTVFRQQNISIKGNKKVFIDLRHEPSGVYQLFISGINYYAVKKLVLN
jgi:hypothetical protein